MKITVEADVAASPETCWKSWTSPEHVMEWNSASPEWHTPSCTIDLRVGGRQVSRMEARDGTAGFDFAATFTAVDPPRRLAFKLDDDREVTVQFTPKGDGTHVHETFDAETENDPEMQRVGWQAILDHFARYTARLD